MPMAPSGLSKLWMGHPLMLTHSSPTRAHFTSLCGAASPHSAVKSEKKFNLRFASKAKMNFSKYFLGTEQTQRSLPVE